MTAVATRLPALVRHFGDRAILPGDSRFEAVRMVWNGMIDTRPAAVVRCADAPEVALALQIARDEGLPVSVRGGGHQIAGAAVVADGLVLDLSPMRAADVCADGTVIAGGGALLGDLDRATARVGRVVPAGTVSHTGVGGLTLGGGVGWLSAKLGLTCDSLLAVELVTASGEIRMVDAERDPDLFWALRGLGPNFGVATRLVFRTHPQGPVVAGRDEVGLGRAAAVLRRLGEHAEHLPRELGVLARFERKADTPVLGVEWVWSGDPALAAAGTAPLGLGRADARTCRFTEVQAAQDHRFPHGRHYFLKPTQLATLGAAEADALVECAARLPEGDPQLEVLRLRGAITDVPQEATSFPGRAAAFAVNVSACWDDPAASGTQSGWARAAHAAIAGLGPGGAYLNFADRHLDLAAVLGPDVHNRLRDVKRRHDPDDVFRPALHITP
ncbi:FAD-binding oxidoreductase [Amycolatopsis sp. FDAARGOS 1241]|uniref:FAD-binding oxidoreductase n=1 Tax=Amycolatopsis sp. FDAARGOS 1241 TaxID=2778070 RepID=UPI00194FE70F|nr:FAD-dependent oxidoreductase [Amycolatopsis sp. FDAARGOS 1241]QRP42654.1 FAD-binding protein [Amycolatopsis sp. FDAARGOS 1241]